MSKLSYMFSNGIELDDKRIYNQKLQGTSTNKKLCFGTIASNYLELTLDNTDMFFDDYSFKNVYINVYDDDTLKMKVYIDSAKEKNKFLTIKAYDKLINLDKTWIPCKTPITLYAFIEDICKQASINMFAFNLINGGFKIQNIEDLKGKTCRQCLSYALEICGTYAFLNANEQLTFKWFDFNNNKNIDISKLVDYNTDYENAIVNNIYFVRGSKVFQTNDTPKGSIYLTKDNPLLKDASSSKVQTILNNLSSKVNMEYLPCSIKAADFFTYNIGDTVSFVDYKGNTRNAIVGSVVYQGYNSCTITSANVDEQDISTSETSQSITNTNTTMANGNITFYRKENDANMEYKECSDITEIQYFLNFNIDEVVDTLQIIINSVPYKTYNLQVGNNTICLMLKGNIIDDTITTIEIDTSNTLTNIEVNSIFRNCLIIDYDEDDEPIGCGEIEYTIPSGSFFRQLKTFKINAGIQDWVYTHNENYLVEDVNDTNYGKTLDIQTLSLSANWNIAANMSDTQNLIEIYNQKNRDLYLDMLNDTFYIRVLFSGTYRDYYKNSYTKENAPLDGWMVYKKKMKNDDDYKIYYTTTGIIEVDDGTEIILGCVCAASREHIWEDFNSFNIHIDNLNDYHQIANISGNGYGTFDTNIEDVPSVKVLNYIANLNLAYPDKCATYNDTLYIGKYDTCIYGSDNYPQYQVIDKTNGIDLTWGSVNLFLFREFAKEGYEIIKETNVE